MKVLHISAECYPAAKAGGLGDVVGALPKYLNKIKVDTGVIIPKYSTKWINKQRFVEVYRGVIRVYNQFIPFAIEQEKTNMLGFPLFVASIPGKYDRPGVYLDEDGKGYGDEIERSLSFQNAVLQWLLQLPTKPAVLHCHDHHTGLIPFMVKHSPEYKSLKNIPTVFTIHNGEYHGSYSWEKMHLLPIFDSDARGYLDWGGVVNPLACGIKCCWKLTTVSPSYMEELRNNSNGLEWLLNSEQHKSIGILNGIDAQVWNPATDKYLSKPLNGSLSKYKNANKKEILEKFNVDPTLPMITFIGRLVREKGADLIPDLITRFIEAGNKASFVILGTGEPRLHDVFRSLSQRYKGMVDVALEYNEGLAHTLYAGSDFLIMPSRVEPCGLNQMYALRYGTIPIVRSIGGLKDTIIDIGDYEGRGIRFNNFTIQDGTMALYRATQLYKDKELLQALRNRIMQLDFSWEKSATEYKNIYQQLTDNSL